MKKLTPLMAVIAACAVIASFPGVGREPGSSIKEALSTTGARPPALLSALKEASIRDEGLHGELQAGQRDALSIIRKYFYPRVKQSSRSSEDCRSDKALLLHNALWQIDPGNVIDLDCSGHLPPQAR